MRTGLTGCHQQAPGTRGTLPAASIAVAARSCSWWRIRYDFSCVWKWCRAYSISPGISVGVWVWENNKRRSLYSLIESNQAGKRLVAMAQADEDKDAEALVLFEVVCAAAIAATTARLLCGRDHSFEKKMGLLLLYL
ncbi:hypothetical protein GQ600_9888 [Phytophthora cactorum]|nr:hypothetical protein GQ600_9888 [Phytophthora cactorum]